jgi:hypothetical protein
MPDKRPTEQEVRADAVRLGDYLAGLGRVEGKTTHGRRVTLHSEGNIWKVSADAGHPVVVIRDR